MKAAPFRTIIKTLMTGNVRDGMLSRKGIIGVVAALFWVAASLTAVASPQTAPTYEQALDALYNLDFSIAERAFDSLIHQDENNPDYWNGRASTILMKILYQQQKFNSE